MSDPKSDEPIGIPIPPTEEQPMTEAVEAEAPIVHPGPAVGYESIVGTPGKTWTHGTLVYTMAGLIVLFFWLLFGDFAISTRERSLGPLIQLMLKGFGTSNLAMSILLTTIPTMISMVLSPIISYKSDRLRSRWGRRIPFLIIPTPIAAVSMLGLAFCPQIAGGLEKMAHGALSHKAALLTVFSVFWTCFDIAAVTSGAVLSGLINDVVPRPVIGRFYAMFRAVSLIDGMIFNWFVLGYAESHFTVIFVWVSLVFGVGFTLMCFMVKEGNYPAPVNLNDHRSSGFFGAVGIYFRECFSQPHYLWIFAAFTLAGMAAGPVNSWILLYAKSIHMNLGKWDPSGIGFGSYRLGYGGIITVTFICSLSLAYPLGSLVDKFSTMRMAIVAMTLYAVAMGISAIFIRGTTSFGWALFAHGVLSGTYFTAAASMSQALLPRAKFSQFASAGGLITHVIGLVWGPSLGAILDWTGSNYRITFVFSFVFATAAVILLLKVYFRYQAMGGPSGYVAPMDDEGDPNPPTGGFPVITAKKH